MDRQMDVVMMLPGMRLWCRCYSEEDDDEVYWRRDLNRRFTVEWVSTWMSWWADLESDVVQQWMMLFMGCLCLFYSLNEQMEIDSVTYCNDIKPQNCNKTSSSSLCTADKTTRAIIKPSSHINIRKKKCSQSCISKSIETCFHTTNKETTTCALENVISLAHDLNIEFMKSFMYNLSVLLHLVMKSCADIL